MVAPFKTGVFLLPSIGTRAEMEPGLPTAPSGLSVSSGANNYTKQYSWTTNDSSYTHEVLSVYLSGTLITRYYIPYHGTGAVSKTVTLGINDQMPGTYLAEISTCNQNHNPWYNGCLGATSVVYAYFSP